MVYLKRDELIKENLTLNEELNNLKKQLKQYKKDNELLKKENNKYKKLGRKKYTNSSTIKLMYHLYLDENKSFKDITNILNKKGIKTKLNKTWSKSSISCILKNDSNIQQYLDKLQYIKFIELLESNKRNIKKK